MQKLFKNQVIHNDTEQGRLYAKCMQIDVDYANDLVVLLTISGLEKAPGRIQLT